MRFVTFFRNVNLGRPGKPTKAQFVEAFEKAGATEVRSFLTHGNAVFSASGKRAALSIVREARVHLQTCCGLTEPAFIRSMKHLSDIVASEPFATGPKKDIYDRCVTFSPAKAVDLLELPVITPKRDVEIFQAGTEEFFSVSRKIGASPGSPNALIERRLGVSATTRSWNTVVRLVKLGD